MKYVVALTLSVVLGFVAWCCYVNRAAADDCFNYAAKSVPCNSDVTFRCVDIPQAGCTSGSQKVIYINTFECGPVLKKNCVPMNDAKTGGALQNPCYDVYKCVWDSDAGKCKMGPLLAGPTAFKSVFETKDCDP